jgi:hypothetical protein
MGLPLGLEMLTLSKNNPAGVSIRGPDFMIVIAPFK